MRGPRAQRPNGSPLPYDGVMPRRFQPPAEFIAIASAAGAARPWLRRVIDNPVREWQRLWTYRTGRRRAAFLSFQEQFLVQHARNIKEMRPLLNEGSATARSAPIADWPANQGSLSIGTLLARHGSDKSTKHDYDVIYDALAGEVGKPGLVLEIGIGTVSERPSSMGLSGSPGASARAFRDWGTRVIACDIDRAILFSEPGIRSFFVDQLRPKTYSQALKAARELGGIDLAVVDGLHTPEADATSLWMIAPLLSTKGLLVIEDIEPEASIVQFWQMILTWIPDPFVCVTFPTRDSWVALLGRRPIWTEGRLTALYSGHG